MYFGNHKRAIRMADFNASAVAEHAWIVGDSVDWNRVTVLDQQKNIQWNLP